ncbi:MAG: hypothetical protein V4547_09205 [Bacteroidota bacterium]
MVAYNKIQKLKEIINSLSEEFGTKNLTYSVNFWFGCSESLKIGDIELNQKPKYVFWGWNQGIGEKDLIELEQEGFLKKISETIDDQDPLEKKIEYEITAALTIHSTSHIP